MAGTPAGVGSVGTPHATSPPMSSDSRLVARMRRFGHAASRVAQRLAAASNTCSQLSTTSRQSRSPRASTMIDSTGRSGSSWSPRADATAGATRVGSARLASSTNHTPSAVAQPGSRSPSARRVLPLPPAPVRVTIRACAHEVLDLRHLVLATHEAGERRGQRRGRRRRTRRRPHHRPQRGVERGVLDEDRLLEPLQRGTGLEAELLAEVVGGPPVGAQRLALPARPVEGEHELTPEPLAQRVLGDQRLELPHHVGRAPEGEVGVEPQLDGAEPELLEPRRLDRGERLVGEVRQGRAPPDARAPPATAPPPRRGRRRGGGPPAPRGPRSDGRRSRPGRRRAHSRADASRSWPSSPRAPCAGATRRPAAS